MIASYSLQRPDHYSKMHSLYIDYVFNIKLYIDIMGIMIGIMFNIMIDIDIMFKIRLNTLFS